MKRREFLGLVAGGIANTLSATHAETIHRNDQRSRTPEDARAALEELKQSAPFRALLDDAQHDFADACDTFVEVAVPETSDRDARTLLREIEEVTQMDLADIMLLASRAAIGTTTTKEVANADDPYTSIISFATYRQRDRIYDQRDLRAVYEHTLENYTVPDNVSLWNFGIYHTPRDFLQNRDLYVELIEEADTVLLEYGRYFANIAQYAHGEGKSVYYVDAAYADRFFTRTTLNTMIATKWLNDAYKHNARWKAIMSVPFAQDSILPIVTDILTGALADRMKELSHSTAHRDMLMACVSFFADVRTVLMLQNTLRIAKAQPGKNLLLITGDMHAAAIDAYLRHPTILALKKALYTATQALPLRTPHAYKPRT